MDILLEGEAGGIFRSRGIIGKDRPGWGGLVNLGGHPVEEGAGYQGTWEAGHQCQVWEKMTKSLPFIHLLVVFILDLKALPKKLCWVFADFVRRQAQESCSLFLLLWYFR